MNSCELLIGIVTEQPCHAVQFTFALIFFLHLVERENGADVHAVQDGQQDLRQPQQVAEVVKAEIDQVPSEVDNLTAGHRGE